MIVQEAARWTPSAVAFDPWNCTQLNTQLTDRDGLQTVEVRQGSRTLSEPTKQLAELVLRGRLAHPDHPILNLHAASLRVKPDSNDNVVPDKKVAKTRIDGMSALITALAAAIREPDVQPSYYETHASGNFLADMRSPMAYTTTTRTYHTDPRPWWQRFGEQIRGLWTGPITSSSPELARLWSSPPTATGISVNEHSALNFSPVWAAVNLIARDCGVLPLRLYRRRPDGGKEPFGDRPITPVPTTTESGDGRDELSADVAIARADLGKRLRGDRARCERPAEVSLSHQP